MGTKGLRAGRDIPNDFALAEGKGWKLGCDRAPSSPDAYCALVGSDTFSIAMTHAEYDDFIKVRVEMPVASLGTVAVIQELGQGATHQSGSRK